MKEVFKKLFGLDNIGEKLGDLADRFIQSKDEKAQFEKEMTQIFIDAEKDIQKNVSERCGF